jgi:hypothetical protein
VAAEERFLDLLAFAEASDDVLGLFVLGSRERGVGLDERSDYDVGVVLRDDDAQARFDEQWPLEHGAPVEVLSYTLDGLREHGAFGSPAEWARYQYAHVEARLDRTGGVLQRILDAKEEVPPDVRDDLVRRSLGAYVNSTYRSLRYGTRLDAAESVSPLLHAVFALESRVRPFNKYLEWELRHHPLPAWHPDTLLALLERVLDGDADAQHELFRAVEHQARANGFGDAIDEWEPDVAWLRGVARYRE